MPTTHFRPRRSVLYMPGSNARALEKARTLPTDAVILDLEDAVAPDAKLQARDQVCQAVKAGGFGAREVVIRVNAADTPWGEADLRAAIEAEPDAILIPKVAAPGDIARPEALMAAAPKRVRLWAMMETPLAIFNARLIAAQAQTEQGRLACFVMGLNDLVKETRVELDSQRTAAQYWLSTCVTAARAFGLDVLDGVYNDFRDLDGFSHECAQGRQFGMDGKTLIHPDQIYLANDAFKPTDAAIARARKIIAAFERPEAQGKGAITLDGRMLELLHLGMARRTVEIAEAIAERE